MSVPDVLAMLGMPGGTEMLVILVVVLIFFGHRIPGLARSLGSGITEFKAGLKDGDGTKRLGADERASPAADESSPKPGA